MVDEDSDDCEVAEDRLRNSSSYAREDRDDEDSPRRKNESLLSLLRLGVNIVLRDESLAVSESNDLNADSIIDRRSAELRDLVDADFSLLGCPIFRAERAVDGEREALSSDRS